MPHMPHVTVTLKYTPKPEGDRVTADIGGADVTFWLSESSLDGPVVVHHPAVDAVTSADAMTFARALALVAGCADDRWRGWHWEARGQNGELLAETPVGEWYVNSYDCMTAIGTLFGTESVVLLDDQYHANVTVREPQPVSVKALDEIRTVATNWATQDTDYDEDTEQQIDDGRAILRILKSHDDTAEADDNIGANYCPDSSLLNYAAAHLAADDTPEADQ